MKHAVFYVIIQRTGTQFKFTAGFKNQLDAEEYIEKFGGVIEPISCPFYKDFAEAEIHTDAITKNVTRLRNIFDDFESMTEDEQIRFKAYHKDSLNQLKELLK